VLLRIPPGIPRWPAPCLRSWRARSSTRPVRGWGRCAPL